jgi:hypothetical protein
MRRRTRRLIAVLGIVLTALVAVAVWGLYASRPRLTGTARLAGLSAPVVIQARYSF